MKSKFKQDANIELMCWLEKHYPVVLHDCLKITKKRSDWNLLDACADITPEIYNYWYLNPNKRGNKMSTNRENAVTPTTCFQWLCAAYAESLAEGKFYAKKLPYTPAVNNISSLASRMGMTRPVKGNMTLRVWADLTRFPTMALGTELSDAYHKEQLEIKAVKKEKALKKANADPIVVPDTTSAPDIPTEAIEPCANIYVEAGIRHQAIVHELKKTNAKLDALIELMK